MAQTQAELLADAEDALHQLVTTGGVIKLMHNGKVIEYARANIGELKAYIAQLRGGRVTTVRLNGSKGL